MTEGDHLVMPNCIKKLKLLMAKINVTESWYNPIERFFQFHTLLFLVANAILTGVLLFNFETTQCKNHFDTNFDKFH